MRTRVAHAKSYPFPIPSHGYLFDSGTYRALTDGPVDVAGRTPVLAAGSNQSPEQLARKYKDFAGDTVIPAERGQLVGFDVVYAAHFAGYGSVPATFQQAPGVSVTVFVLWLTDGQLDHMHKTEGNYSFDRIDATPLHLERPGGMVPGGLDAAYVYSSRAGCIGREGVCVALAEIPADGRQFDALTQSEIQAHVRDVLDPGAGMDDFINRNIGDADLPTNLRAEHTDRLAALSICIEYPREIIREC